MKFVFICDSNYMKGDLANLVSNFPRNHEVIPMSSEELLKNKALPEGAFGILMERNTWQKNFSVFRYFRLLPTLESLPMAIVSRGRRSEPLKGRLVMKGKETFLSPSASPEELFSQIDRFVTTPTPSHVHPRGRAKA